ncbi:alanine--tRNA ligase, mitochondrial-like, partial [Uranotaenia lowii]|uniref:alanine--tRNA ligase, mitochondrial-like n=1 Tax=Uranotaenia lowii TaxID=190385 RepID=UPI00247A983B
TYPEMDRKLQETQQIVEHEEQVYRQLCSNVSSEARTLLNKYPQFLDEADIVDHPGLPHALKEIQRLKLTNPSLLGGEAIHKMYDTYGLDEDMLTKIGLFEELKFDFQDYEQYSRRLKEGAKLELATRLHESLEASKSLDFRQTEINPTQNQYKYNFVYNADKNCYEIPQLKTKIAAIVKTKGAKSNVYHVITEKSNFYPESGGQQSDKGNISLASDSKVQLAVRSVSEKQGLILHTIEGDDRSMELFSTGDEVLLTVDPAKRTGSTIHHTATHLLNAGVRKCLGVPICQRSSFVGDKALKLELVVCGPKIGLEDVDAIEQHVRQAIQSNHPVRIRVCDVKDVNLDQVTTIPGEVYPEKGLRLVEIGSSTSTEFCCGTHAQYTGELQDFCIIDLAQTKPGCFSFHAIVGQPASKAQQLGRQINIDVNQLKADMDQQDLPQGFSSHIDARMQRLKNVLLVGSDNNINLPYAIRQRCLDVIQELYKRLKDQSRESLRELIDLEMRNLQEEKPVDKYPFLVHFLECSVILQEVQLSKATRHFVDRPVLVISITDEQVKARATVPSSFINERFDAHKWLQTVGAVFKSPMAAPKGQNAAEVCNMKVKKVKLSQFETLLEKATNDASEFASQHLG